MVEEYDLESRKVNQERRELNGAKEIYDYEHWQPDMDLYKKVCTATNVHFTRSYDHYEDKYSWDSAFGQFSSLGKMRLMKFKERLIIFDEHEGVWYMDFDQDLQYLRENKKIDG
jgi:hypothetical protein